MFNFIYYSRIHEQQLRRLTYRYGVLDHRVLSVLITVLSIMSLKVIIFFCCCCSHHFNGPLMSFSCKWLFHCIYCSGNAVAMNQSLWFPVYLLFISSFMGRGLGQSWLNNHTRSKFGFHYVTAGSNLNLMKVSLFVYLPTRRRTSGLHVHPTPVGKNNNIRYYTL